MFLRFVFNFSNGNLKNTFIFNFQLSIFNSSCIQSFLQRMSTLPSRCAGMSLPYVPAEQQLFNFQFSTFNFQLSPEVTNVSFSSDAKAELCRDFINRKCCAMAEASGVLLFCNTVSQEQIRIVTESEAFAARLPQLFSIAFRLDFDELQSGSKFTFQLLDREKIRSVFQTIGYSPRDSITLHVNYGLLEKECCRVSFLRGAFLSGGSVTDPEKRYHLELATSHHKVSRETESLLLEQGFAPKSTLRNGSSILYFKQSDAIEDFLTLLGAPVAAMGLMEAKIEKEMKNKINRIVNCDNANTQKVVEAAQTQIAAIRRLEERGLLETLPEKLRQTAALRMENPEVNLNELAELFDPPLTKSALNHRLRKLCELAANETS